MKWIVDECPDANGYWTIRLDDGTGHADTEAQPIATVYDRANAESIVTDHNRPFADIVASLQEIQTDAGDALDRSGQYTSDRIGEVLKKLPTVV